MLHEYKHRSFRTCGWNAGRVHAIRIRFVREIAANASRAFSSNKREEPRGRQPVRRTWFTCARVWLIRVSGEPDNRQPARSCFLGLNRSKMVRVKRVCVYVTRARFARHAMNFRVMKVKWKFPVITAILSNGPNRGAILRRLNSHAPLNVSRCVHLILKFR